MAVEILPQNTITPALKDVFGQMSNINAMKMQEETRKRNELADLTAISLQNISSNDNIYLQQEKEKFISEAAKSYGANKGYLPYEIQADLNTKKSNIIMEAKASEEWKKQYEDVVKQMATSDKIDKEKTAANLQSMMLNPDGTPKPPSARPNPYNAVSLNFDTNEYIRQNLNKETSESTSMEGRKIITTKERTPENVFNQIKSFSQGNQAFGMKMAEEAREAGYSDVDTYIKEVKVPTYVKKDQTYTYHWPSQGNNYFFGSGAAGGTGAGTPGQGITVKYKDTNNNINTATYTPARTVAVPPATVTLNGKDIIYSNNTLKNVADPRDIAIQSVGYFPSTYNARLGKWFIITDENRKEYEGKPQEEKPYFVGTTKITSSEGSYDVVSFVPATEERKQVLNKKLGNDTGKPGFDVTTVAGSFDAPKTEQPKTTKSGSLSEAKKAYPNMTEAQLREAYRTQYGIELK